MPALAAEIRPQLAARRRATNRRREESEVKNEICEVGMMIVVTMRRERRWSSAVVKTRNHLFSIPDELRISV